MLYFNHNPITDTWVPDADIRAVLIRSVDGSGSTTGWTLKTKDDVTETYDATGRLTEIRAINNDTQTLQYLSNGKLQRVDSNRGQYLEFTYDGAGNMSTMTNQAGQVWTYKYTQETASQNLESLHLEYVYYPDDTPADLSDNPYRRYHYNESQYTAGQDYTNAMTGISDFVDGVEVRYATYEYETGGNAIASYLPGNAGRVDITYNTDGTRVVTKSTIDPNTNNGQSTYTTTAQLGTGLVTDISGPGCSACNSGNTSYIHDPADNNLLSKTENGVTTQYGNYDANGNPGFMIEASGTSRQRRTDYEYHPDYSSKVTKILEPSVRASDPTAQCTEGVDCRNTTYDYDAYGNRTLERMDGFAPDGAGGWQPVYRETRYRYGGTGPSDCPETDAPFHQLCEIDGPRTDISDITHFRYYPDDPVEGNNRARLKEIEDATGTLIRSNIQYTATGQVAAETRPNGLSLTYTYYPGNDRLETLTESDGTSSRVTRWTYLTTGEVESITQAHNTPEATTLTFGYDDARRLTRLTDGLGNYIEYTLDTEGNREAERTYDSSGALKKQLAQTFDLYNRLDTTAQANETTNPSYAPDGTLDTQTDGKGVITDYSYDALKRLTQAEQDEGGTDPTTTNATTGYGYDSADRLTSVTDPVNGNTVYIYDDLGNLLSQTSPDSGATTFSYDSAGNLKTKTDAKTQTFSYSYDALNRLTTLDGTDSDVNYGYDSCTNGSGRLCRVSTAEAVVNTRYDHFGNVSELPAITSTYDRAGRIKTLTYPSGAKVTYSYNAAGQVGGVTLTVNGVTQTLASNLSYAPFGPLTGLTYGNGLSLTQSLDTAYRITSQTIPGVLSLSYPQYDTNGNLTTRSDTGQTETYAYDALDRLDTANGPFGARDYGYDKNGNRTALDGTTYAYTPNSNRLDAIGSADVLLDNNGNTLNKGTWTFDYTAHNRLRASYANGVLAANYSYNGLGQRIAKTKPDGSGRHFLYGTSGELLAETDNDGNLLNEYIYLNGQPLAVYQPDEDSDGLSNAEEDPIGSNPANTDGDGDGLTNLAEWYTTGTNARQADSDGDGVLDGAEVTAGTDPQSPTNYPGDGDVNQDGEVNVGDLLLVMQMAMGQRIPTPEQQLHADVHTDGVIDARDMLKLERRILGLSLLEWINAMPGSQRMLAMLDRVLDIDLINTAEAAVASGKLFYIHTDHLGTPKALTNEAEAKVWSAVHDPFGLATVDEDSDGNGQAVTFNLRFAGQYADAETGLHYNYFRTYDSSIGRYLESDPIGLNGGLNTYAYVGSNPLKYFDLYGLAAQMCYRPFYPIPQPNARHCFLKFSDGSSSSFDPGGTHEDPAPDWWPKSCQDTDGEQDDDCLKRAMKKCKADKYDFTGFNCCHCVEQAMRECGLGVPRDSWPNWPVNPGPQPGESGYKPMPQYGVPQP